MCTSQWAMLINKSNQLCQIPYSPQGQPSQTIPKNGRRGASVALMLGQRRRRWPNIKTMLAQQIRHADLWLPKTFSQRWAYVSNVCPASNRCWISISRHVVYSSSPKIQNASSRTNPDEACPDQDKGLFTRSSHGCRYDVSRLAATHSIKSSATNWSHIRSEMMCQTDRRKNDSLS